MNLGSGWNRRSFLSMLAAATGNLLSPSRLNAEGMFSKKGKQTIPPVDGHPIVPITSGLGSTGDIYAELGVTPLININGTVTVIGGSVMRPEVMELMRQGNQHFVLINELEVAAGKFIAKLCKSPEGYTGLVTAGAAAAMVVGYAGMMTEDLEPRITSCPDVSGFPRTEVIIQKSHRYPFDHQIRQTGAKLVEVETREEMIAAINPKTLAIHFTNILSDRGKVSGPETVAIAKAHNIYTFNDASADVPPKERLWEYPALGFDMVTFSGGKDICGPQASGVLIGKEELIRWSMLNMSPQEDRIGRPCKVGKETIFALLKALELFVNQDYDSVLKMYDARAQVITDAIKKFGVTALPREFNPQALGNVTPHYSWHIDPAKLKITGPEVMQKLADTKPVGIGSMGAGASGLRGRNPDAPAGPPPERRRRPSDPSVFGFALWQIKDGEDKIIADRLVQIFSEAPKA
ncbi:aminotransferase class V-fold PLP-dependent enzyme [Terriglobus albidus]|uniref:Aminotransferase class V-fold PLP-dependent enzyme n=1 Tax=Terriglobus albidus TaxID=1592106 RepID=A0A5B9EGV4_9BACT|nr:aminotransferase class V-fold PLP-dependent enzyme [Terriglobus albidus]QEE30040.1 aminotransferase class V-fold PLP-dependent enzyme [Terriglobus albidus]